MTAAVARSTRAESRERVSAGRGRAASRTRHPAGRAVSSGAKIVRPHLKVLDQQAIRRRARRRNMAMALFVVVIIGSFAAALAQAQLVANQRELDELRGRIAETEANRARLERLVEESSAPSAILERAAEIGLVRANDPMYLTATAAAPEITPVKLGTATAVTEALSGAEVEVAGAVGSDVTVSTNESAGPVVASVAGIRAVSTGVGTG